MKPDETPPEAVTEEEPGGEEFEAPLGAGIDFSDPNSPLAPFYLRASHLVALLILVFVFLLHNFFPLWHTDVWGHLKFGEWMVEHRSLPGHEPFSPFADKQATYVNFQWISQAGLYLLYQAGEALAGGDATRRMAGGAEMLHTAHVLLALSSYAFLLLAYRRRAGSLPLACAGLLVLLALTPTPLAIFRPQVGGVVLFAALLTALSLPVLSRRALFAVPLLMVVWANLHGSYAVGLVLLGCLTVGRILDVAWVDGAWSLSRVRNDAQTCRLLLVLTVSVMAVACLNPHGPYLYLYTVRMGGHPNIRTLDEWAPVDFKLGPGGHWAYLAALTLLIVTQVVSPGGLMPSQFILLATFGVWPLFQQRMMIWWLLLLPWMILPAWAALGERLSWEWLRYQSVPSFRKTLLAGFIVVVFLLWSAPAQWLIHRGPRPMDRVVSLGTPWRVAAELEAEGAERGKWLAPLRQELDRLYPGGQLRGRIFASETQADYLLWSLPPELPMLIYSHVHLFPPEHWLDCLTVKVAGAGWWEILDRHRVNLVIVEPLYNPALAAALRKAPEWRVVLDEEADASKRDPRTRVIIALRNNPK